MQVIPGQLRWITVLFMSTIKIMVLIFFQLSLMVIPQIQAHHPSLIAMDTHGICIGVEAHNFMLLGI